MTVADIFANCMPRQDRNHKLADMAANCDLMDLVDIKARLTDQIQDGYNDGSVEALAIAVREREAAEACSFLTSAFAGHTEYVAA
jgi:hypothetical protein